MRPFNKCSVICITALLGYSIPVSAQQISPVGGGGGSGVTSVATGAGLTGGPITSTGTVSATEILGNSGAPITGSTYAVNLTPPGDLATELLFTGSGASAWSLGSGSAGEGFDAVNQGTANITITATGNINGASTLVLLPGQSANVFYGSSTWQAQVALGSSVGTAAFKNTGTSGSTVPLLNGSNVYSAQQSNSTTTLSISTATFTPDGTNNNYKLTLVHASCPCTLANPSATPVAGTAGVIEIIQSSTGSDTITTWGSEYIYAGGTATISLSSGVSDEDFLSYFVIDSTHILLTTASLNASH